MQLVFFALEMLEKTANAAETTPAGLIPKDNQFLLFGVEFIPGLVERYSGRAGEPLQFGEQRPVFWFGPGLDRPLVQSFAFVWNDEVEIEIDGIAKALAARTRAIRIVERKQARLGLVVAAAIVLALKTLRETQPLRSLARGRALCISRRGFKNNLARLPISNLNCVDDSGTLVRGNNKTIHQPENGFGKIDVKQRFGSRELENLAILKQAIKAALAQLEKPGLDRVGRQAHLGRLFLSTRLFGALFLGSGNQRLNREKHIQASALAEGHQAFHDFIHCVFFYFLAAEQAVGSSDTGKEKAQIIEDLGRGGNCRSRIACGIFLLDRYGGRNSVDQVDVRLLDPFQKLARVGRQRFDVTTLALRVDRIEGERRLPRTGDAGNHGQSVVLNLKINVLEVMNSGPANHNAVCRHLPLALRIDQNSLPNLLL